MSERTTLEIIAPTVEEALQQGLTQLGLTADAVSIEVLDSGTKGLFGLGGRQVRVRLSGYWREDLNMDGTAKYTGSLNDRDRILVNVGPTTPNNTRVATLP